MPDGFLKGRGSIKSETRFAINFSLTKGEPLLTIFRKNWCHHHWTRVLAFDRTLPHTIEDIPVHACPKWITLPPAPWELSLDLVGGIKFLNWERCIIHEGELCKWEKITKFCKKLSSLLFWNTGKNVTLSEISNLKINLKNLLKENLESQNHNNL